MLLHRVDPEGAMSELIQEYTAEVRDDSGRLYTARVRGETDSVGHWQGWIEFLPRDGGPALQTGRETTQSTQDHLRYWATGLSPDYLESALARANRTHSTSPAPPPPLEDPTYDAARIRDPQPDSAVVEMELETLDSAVPLRLMHKRELRAGNVRRVPGGGIIVYDGVEAAEGAPSRHRFLVQYGSENSAAVLANHMWSDLREEGVTLRVRGRKIAITNYDLAEALRSHL
jgi:hypothetical protein